MKGLYSTQSELEKKPFTSCPEACWSVDISIKDDVTVIFLLSVSFMVLAYPRTKKHSLAVTLNLRRLPDVVFALQILGIREYFFLSFLHILLYFTEAYIVFSPFTSKIYGAISSFTSDMLIAKPTFTV